MDAITMDLVLNFLDRNIGYRQFDELPKHKEGSLYHNKYSLELDILKETKRRVLRDELNREPLEEEMDVSHMVESLTKYF